MGRTVQEKRAVTQDEFRELIVASGPLEDEILAIADLTETTLVVTLGAVAVDEEHAAARGQAIFAAAAGVPPAGREAAVHRFLLLSNAMLAETGVVAALTGSAGEVQLMAPLPLAGLTPAGVAIVVRNLAERALALREAVALGLGEAETAAPAPVGDETLLRV